jgi:hypothetical protein
MVQAQLGRNPRREIADSCLDVIARSLCDEAIQLCSLHQSWIASLALAMTVLGCLKIESEICKASWRIFVSAA